MQEAKKQKLDKIKKQLNLLTSDELNEISDYVEKSYIRCNQEHHQALFQKD